jgi:uncharacterized protein
MKQRVFDPLRLDVAAFAADAGGLEGEWPLAELPRLAEGAVAAPADAAPEPVPVRWAAGGEARPRRAAEPEVWLHLEADAVVWLQCQRCLQPVREDLQVQRSFRFVRSEAEAEAEDADSEEDVLALTRSLDLRALVEDELILELPLVPRHEACPEPLPMPLPAPLEAQAEATKPNPFAQLAVLKRGKSSH